MRPNARYGPSLVDRGAGNSTTCDAEAEGEAAPIQQPVPSTRWRPSVDFTPNPNRRHTRGRRGKSVLVPGYMQEEFEAAHEDWHRVKMAVRGRAHAQQERAQQRKFREKGLTKEAKQKTVELPAAMRRSMRAVAANHARTSTKPTRQELDFRNFDAVDARARRGKKVKKPATTRKQSVVQAEISRERIVREANLYKRTGKCPSDEVCRWLETPAGLAHLPATLGKAKRSLLSEASARMQELLRAGDVEPNPGPESWLERHQRIWQRQQQLKALVLTDDCEAFVLAVDRGLLHDGLKCSPLFQWATKVRSCRVYPEFSVDSVCAMIMNAIEDVECHTEWAHLEVHREKLARLRCLTKAEVQALLVRGGIHPNPGPRQPKPGKQKKKAVEGEGTVSLPQMAKQARLNADMVAARLDDLMDPEVQAQLAAARAEASASAAAAAAEAVTRDPEKEAAEAEEQKAKEEAERVRAAEMRFRQSPLLRNTFAVRWFARHTPEALEKIEGFFHMFRASDVATDIAHLPPNPFPCVDVLCTLKSVEHAGDSRLAVEQVTPLSSSEPGRTPEFVVTYSVHVYRRTFGGVTESEEDIEVRLSSTDLLICHRSNLGEGLEFDLVYQKVNARLSRFRDAAQDVFLESHRQWQVCLITALLCLLPGDPRVPTMTEFLTANGVRAMLKSSHYFLNTPMAPGLYIHGYRVTPEEVLKQADLPVGFRVAGKRFRVLLDEAHTAARCRMYRAVGAIPQLPILDKPALMAGAIKRILLPPGPIDPIASQIVERIYGVLAAEAQAGVGVFDAEELVGRFFRADGPGQKYSQLQREQCMELAAILESDPAALNGTFHLRGMEFTLADLCSHMGVFIKDELYGGPDKKAPRYITSPEAVARFLLHALFHISEHALLSGFCLRHASVKGLTMPERLTLLDERFGASEGAFFFEDDISSMERQIRDDYLRYENALLVSTTATTLRGVAEAVCALLEQDRFLRNKRFVMKSPPNRASGTQQTSIGNTCANFAWKAASLLTYSYTEQEVLSMPQPEFVAELHNIAQRLVVEGDDALFMHKEDVSAHVNAYYEKLGVPNKLKMARRYQELSFCGAHMDGERVLRDPIQALSKFVSLYGQYMATTRHDAAVMCSRALSTITELGADYPVVGPAAVAVLRSAPGVARRVAEDLKRVHLGQHVKGAAKLIYKELRNAHAWMSDAMFSDWIAKAAAAADQPIQTRSSAEMRAAVGVFGYSPAQIEAAEIEAVRAMEEPGTSALHAQTETVQHRAERVQAQVVVEEVPDGRRAALHNAMRRAARGWQVAKEGYVKCTSWVLAAMAGLVCVMLASFGAIALSVAVPFGPAGLLIGPLVLIAELLLAWAALFIGYIILVLMLRMVFGQALTSYFSMTVVTLIVYAFIDVIGKAWSDTVTFALLVGQPTAMLIDVIIWPLLWFTGRSFFARNQERTRWSVIISLVRENEFRADLFSELRRRNNQTPSEWVNGLPAPLRTQFAG